MWSLLLFLAVSVTGMNIKYQTVEVEDRDYWLSMASAKLDEVMKRQPRDTPAKNIIVFVGDGMGMSTITAGRIFQGQLKEQAGENNILSFEKFPVTGLSKTYNFDTQVPDSASTATAIFTGVKTRHYVLGLDSIASFNVCIPETNRKAVVTSMMTWAQKSGRDTGIVTTTRITHATPAATYSHVNNRNWECDSSMPRSEVGCVKDIARQLVEDAPGREFKVILGGGRNSLGDAHDLSARDGSCVRSDGRNLAKEWKNSKSNSEYVTSADELSKVNFKKTDYLLGLFAPGHVPYAAENRLNRPTLRQMTEAAIRILKKNSRGFVLMVEGGRIDHGHHINTPGLALSELVEFDDAVDAAFKMTNSDETLIIVTADHSHAMTMNGYPERGNDILGLAQNKSDSFYETLTYANGPSFTYHHMVNKTENCNGLCSPEERESVNSWRNLRNDSSRYKNLFYQHLASVYLPEETHGGEDVPIYATGPMSHLLSGVHEQNYIATVISYAGCMGPQAHRCTESKQKLSSSAAVVSGATLPALLTLLAMLLNS